MLTDFNRRRLSKAYSLEGAANIDTMEGLYDSSISGAMLVCIIAALLVLMRKVVEMRAGKLPPGPRGLPIIGHLHLLGKLPHRTLYELSKSHGPLMSLRLGSLSFVVASSPEMARQLLQRHDLAFSNRMPLAAARLIFGEDIDIGFSNPNASWKLLRRLFATEMVSTKGFHFFKPVRAEEVSALMRSVLADSAMDDNAAPQQLRRKLKVANNNILMRMIIGKKGSELAGGRQDVDGHSRKASVVELIEETFEMLGKFNVGDYMPCVAWMDLQGIQRRSKRLASDLRRAFQEIIDTRRLDYTEGRPPNDFLDVLLQASATSDTPIHIMEVVLDLIIAGTDTTIVSVEWTLAELLSNPEKLRLVQEEIDEVVGRERLVQEDDIEKLPFLLACVKETMRIHPVAPLLAPRKTNKACDILGFHIPANTNAFINTWAIGRDSRIWENPTIFCPERFLKLNTMDVQGQNFELLPFGSGRRICPGWRLALVSAQLFLASLLQGFEWSIPSSNHLDMSEYFRLSLCLATPLVVCATPRLPKELY